VKLPRSRGTAPWAIASFIAIPLFFCALMCSTLAQEKPYLIQWKGCKNGLCTTWHDPTSATEARIWLWALLPPLLLSLVGWICMRIPYGWYVSCVAAIVIAIGVCHRLTSWTVHHTLRFPNGVDLIPGTNLASNQYDPGEWEKMARETALSFQHWTIALAIISIVAMLALEVRRRYFSRRPLLEDLAAVGPGIEGVHGADLTGASVPIE